MLVKVKRKSYPVEISSEFIKLDAFFKFAAITQTGGEAKLVITDGLVKVNGEVCTMRGKKLYPSDTVEFNGKLYTITKA